MNEIISECKFVEYEWSRSTWLRKLISYRNMPEAASPSELAAETWEARGTDAPRSTVGCLPTRPTGASARCRWSADPDGRRSMLLLSPRVFQSYHRASSGWRCLTPWYIRQDSQTLSECGHLVLDPETWPFDHWWTPPRIANAINWTLEIYLAVCSFVCLEFCACGHT